MNQLIWHYTSGTHLDKIMETGELRVSQTEIRLKIKPATLWFSLNPVWESTATKMIIDGFGRQRFLTLKEQHNLVGLIRFSIPFEKEKMCSWHKYKHKVNLPLPVLIQMEMEGIKKGANPNEWYAFFCNIPLSRCISCEKWDGKKWVEHIKNLGEYCISKSN